MWCPVSQRRRIMRDLRQLPRVRHIPKHRRGPHVLVALCERDPAVPDGGQELREEVGEHRPADNEAARRGSKPGVRGVRDGLHVGRGSDFVEHGVQRTEGS